MPFEASGLGGEVNVGHYRAADLSSWEIRRREETLGDDVTVLTAAVSGVDRFWLHFRPQASVRLRMGGCWWVWDSAEIQSAEPLEVWLYGNPRSIPR